MQLSEHTCAAGALTKLVNPGCLDLTGWIHMYHTFQGKFDLDQDNF